MRLGEWDLSSKTEPLPFKEFMVAATFMHPGFDIKTSKNNIAVLRLSKNVMLGEFPTIGTGCLPCKLIIDKSLVVSFKNYQLATPITGIRCWVSGWTNPTTKKQDVLRKVDLPLIDNESCQNLLRKTLLGPKYVLDSKSFICAGAEKGKGKVLILS